MIRKEIKIGIMVVVALFALIFGINYLKGFNIFMPTNSFYVRYAQLDGLEKSAPVFVQGYKIGQVRDITFDFTKKEPFTVLVALNEDMKIPKGSVFELFDDGLLGSKSIQILLNNSSTEYYSSGDTIPSSIASNLFSEVGESILPSVKNIIPRIDSLLYAAQLVIQNQSINNALLSLEKSSRDLEIISSVLKRTMQNDIPIITGNAKTISDNLVSTTQRIDNIDMVGIMSKLDSTMQALNNITGKIDSGEGTLGLLINDKTLFENLSNTSESANQLIIDLKKNPKRYVHFSIFGKKAKE